MSRLLQPLFIFTPAPQTAGAQAGEPGDRIHHADARIWSRRNLLNELIHCTQTIPQGDDGFLVEMNSEKCPAELSAGASKEVES